MNPTTTNVEERDQWRARLNRALSELQVEPPHIDGRVTSDDSSADTSFNTSSS